MTAFERSKIKGADQERAAQEAKEREMAAKRQVSEEDYARQMRLDEANTNRYYAWLQIALAARRLPRLASLLSVRMFDFRNEDEVNATGLSQALNALTEDMSSTDIHPEKRVKAAFNAYYEANLPELRSQKPGLRANQYRDMLWKQFQKSPANPMNRLPPT